MAMTVYVFRCMTRVGLPLIVPFEDRVRPLGKRGEIMNLEKTVSARCMSG